MQVSVETTGAVDRRMTIQIPAEKVDGEVTSRLENLARTARIDGFRPGKVPMKVVARKYGQQVRKEVVDQVVRTTLDEAMAQEQLKPAGEPRVEWPDNTQAGQALECVVTFQVYPELTAVQLGDAAIERPMVNINDEDLAVVLDKLRKQRATWVPVDRESRLGDRLTINHLGTINGESFPGSHGVKVEVELGSAAIVDGFDDQLVGMAPDSKKTLTVTYPEQGYAQEVAGKQASFEVTVISVAESQLPELNDDLASSFGITEGGLDKFKEEVRENMARELEQTLRLVMKDRVFDRLLEQNQVEVPTGLVDKELELVALTAKQFGGADGASERVAERENKRVALGMLVGKIVEDQNIQVDSARVRDMVEAVAATYENPDEVVAWYYDSPDRLNEAQAAILEDQVVDWVLEQVPVNDKSMTFEELMQLRSDTGT
jgi:trigger factor